MADWFYGCISFPASRLDDEVLKMLQDNNINIQRANGELEMHYQGNTEVNLEDGIFTLIDHQARYGEFPEIEELLQSKGIPFDRDSAGKYDYDPERRIYRPAGDNQPEVNVTMPTNNAGAEVVNVDTVRDLMEQGYEQLKDWLDNHYPFYPPLSSYVTKSEYQFSDPYCEDPPAPGLIFKRMSHEELTADQARGICCICGDLIIHDKWRDHLISHGTAFGSTDFDPGKFFDKE